MNIEKKKKGGKKGGRGCKLLIVSLLSTLALSSCTVTLAPQDDLVKVVNNQGQVLQEVIKVLQEKKIIEEKK